MQGQSHCLLLVEPVLLPDLGHTGVTRESIPGDRPFFYPNGVKNSGLGTTIRNTLFGAGLGSSNSLNVPPSYVGVAGGGGGGATTSGTASYHHNSHQNPYVLGQQLSTSDCSLSTQSVHPALPEESSTVLSAPILAGRGGRTPTDVWGTPPRRWHGSGSTERCTLKERGTSLGSTPIASAGARSSMRKKALNKKANAMTLRRNSCGSGRRCQSDGSAQMRERTFEGESMRGHLQENEKNVDLSSSSVSDRHGRSLQQPPEGGGTYGQPHPASAGSFDGDTADQDNWSSRYDTASNTIATASTSKTRIIGDESRGETGSYDSLHRHNSFATTSGAHVDSQENGDASASESRGEDSRTATERFCSSSASMRDSGDGKRGCAFRMASTDGAGRDSEWSTERRAANQEASELLGALRHNNIRLWQLVGGGV